MSSDEVVGVKNSLPFLHTWKLERLFSFVSSSEKMWDYSGVFPAGGYGWKLALKLDKVEAKEGISYLSLFLGLMDASPPPLYIEVVVESSLLDENYSQRGKRKDGASTPPPFVMVRAEFYIDLVDQIEGKNHQLRCHHLFDCESPWRGWRKFLSLDALHEPSRGLLVNDTCIVKVGFLKCDISE